MESKKGQLHGCLVALLAYIWLCWTAEVLVVLVGSSRFLLEHKHNSTLVAAWFVPLTAVCILSLRPTGSEAPRRNILDLLALWSFGFSWLFMASLCSACAVVDSLAGWVIFAFAAAVMLGVCVMRRKEALIDKIVLFAGWMGLGERPNATERRRIMTEENGNRPGDSSRQYPPRKDGRERKKQEILPPVRSSEGILVVRGANTPMERIQETFWGAVDASCERASIRQAIATARTDTRYQEELLRNAVVTRQRREEELKHNLISQQHMVEKHKVDTELLEQEEKKLKAKQKRDAAQGREDSLRKKNNAEIEEQELSVCVKLEEHKLKIAEVKAKKDGIENPLPPPPPPPRRPTREERLEQRKAVINRQRADSIEAAQEIEDPEKRAEFIKKAERDYEEAIARLQERINRGTV